MTGRDDQRQKTPTLQQALGALRKMRGRLEALERERSEPVAVVGIGCRFPGGVHDPGSYWSLLRDGTDAIREVPADRWDVESYYDPDPDTPGKMATRWGGFLDAVDGFDPRLFGIAPREAVSMDPQQRLLLEVAWEALEHAGLAPDRLAGSATGVFLGMSGSDYIQRQLQGGDPAAIDAYFATGNVASAAAGRLSYVLGLQGPCLAVDTACSSSLVAAQLACQSLRTRECDMALAAGVNLMLLPEVTITLSKARMMASDGRCKTFDDRADGFVRGEGCGLVVLKRLADAQADGDRVLAVIRGWASNQDGRSSGLTAPNGVAQKEVIRRALERGGVDPRAVGYVETHGTGTSLGDPIEVQALAAVLGEGRPAERPVALGSVKTNIGHLEAAAGIAGLIKLVLVLRHGEIPPHLHLQRKNRYIPWEELPVTIPAGGVAWPRPDGGRRLAGVSSFGFAGTNAHLVLEEAPAPEVESPASETARLLPLSARSAEALRASAERWASALAGRDGETGEAPAVADACYTAGVGRAHFEHRLAVVGESGDELADALDRYAAGDRAAVAHGVVSDPRGPEVAFLFPGQGAQKVGLGRDLYAVEPVVREVLDRCDGLLRDVLERPLLSVMFGEGDGAEETLRRTEYAQPALFALEVALAALWRSWGVEPAAVIGHSVGEIAAACVAGALELEDGLRLIAARGRRMGELPEGGAMASVMHRPGLSDAVAAVLERAGEGLSLAADNGAGGMTLSGDEEALEGALASLSEQGFKSRRLAVSHGFHSARMEPTLEGFAEDLEGVEHRPASIDWISCLRGERVGADELLDAGHWVRHVREPVRFGDGMAALADLGVRSFVEVGPGTTLSGMGRRCLESRFEPGDGEAGPAPVWLPSLRPGRPERRQMLHALGTLYTRGVPVDWSGTHAGEARRRISMPTYPFQRRSYWIEPGMPPRIGEAVEESSGRRDGAEVHRWLYELTWRRSPRTGEAEAAPTDGGPWLIVDGEGAVEGPAARLAAQLEGRGARAVAAGPEAAEARLVGDGEVGGVVYLGLAPGAEEGCRRALGLVRALADRAARDRPGEDWSGLWFVTAGAQALGAEEEGAIGQTGLEQAPLWGLGRTVAHEHPDLWGGLVDLAPGGLEDGTGLEALAEELTAPDREAEIALRPGGRYVARIAAWRGDGTEGREEPSQGPRGQVDQVDPTGAGVHLVTGGLGGLGLRVARWLVDRGARHLVLVGRSGPSGKAEKAVRRLEELGARVDVERLDVGDRDGVAGFLDRLERENTALRGVFHAAGVLDDGVLAGLEPERLDRVLAPKIAGARNLHELTTQRAPGLFVMFSSAASLLGPPGQGAYAAANAYLDALARHRRAAGLPALSVAWGPWAEIGMAARAATPDRFRGARPIAPDRAIEALELLLVREATAVAVLDADWRALADRLPAGASVRRLEECLPAGGSDADGGLRSEGERRALERFLETPPEDRRSFVERYLCHCVSTAIGVPEDTMDSGADIFDLGADSLMVMEVAERCKCDFELPIYPRELYEHPTVGELADYLAGELERGTDTSVDGSGEGSGPSLAPPSVAPAEALPADERNPSAVFLLSSPRSGSTLLRVMLAGHPGLFCPPELHLLPFAQMADRRRELELSHLGEGLQRSLMELRDLDADDSRELVEELADREESVHRVYRTLQDLAGDRLLVDKSPTYALDLETLRRAEALFDEPRYVVLVRHPYAVVESVVRNRMDRLAGVGSDDPHRFGEQLWSRAYGNILAFERELREGGGSGADRLHRVRFEDLVTDPERVMAGVCDFLGLPFDRAVLRPYEGERMTDGVHDRSKGIGDPGFLEHRGIEPELAEAWRTVELPRPLRPRGRRLALELGYELPDPAGETSGTSVVVPLREEGEGPPLYCFHPAGGEVHVYRRLVRRLVGRRGGGAVPVRAVRSRALEDWTSEHRSLEEMAAAYAEALQEDRPAGPFRLLGWSMGGRIALAVAAELEAAGRIVERVALWDSRYPTQLPGNFPEGDGAVPSELAPYLLAFGGALAGAVTSLSRDERRELQEDLLEAAASERPRRIVEWGQRQGALPSGVSPEALEQQAGLVKAHLEMLREHTPRPISAPVTVWWAGDDLATRDPTDWGRFTSGAYREETVSGDHFSMVRPPHLEELAEGLQAWIGASTEEVTA